MAQVRCVTPSTRCSAGRDWARRQSASSQKPGRFRGYTRAFCEGGKQGWAGAAALGALASAIVTANGPAQAGGKATLPPIDPDPQRCERAELGNNIGEPNGLGGSILDLRQCDFTSKQLSGKNLSGALMSESTFQQADLSAASLTKAYAAYSDFQGASLTNAVLDRADFTRASLRGANLSGALVSRTDFSEADLSEANLEGAVVALQDLKTLCANPSLSEDSRGSIGCPE